MILTSSNWYWWHPSVNDVSIWKSQWHQLSSDDSDVDIDQSNGNPMTMSVSILLLINIIDDVKPNIGPISQMMFNDDKLLNDK